MKNAKKRIAWMLALCLTVTGLLSCARDGDGEDTTEAGSSEAAITVTETEAPETTAAVTETETEPETETATETETETAAVTETPESEYPSVVEDNGKDMPQNIAPAAEGVYLDPLTGTVVEKEEAERRPVAIMINNIATALPQQQLASADVVYECQVEGGLTRLLGVYNNWEDLEAIGSVRSAREYYIDFAANHDAVFFHAGGSTSAYEDFKARNTQRVDAVNDYTVSGFFYRDPNRVGKMSYEHTLVIDGDQIAPAIEKKGYRTTYASTFSNPLKFVGAEQTVSLTNGSSAKDVTVKFAYHTTQFVYDAASNRYLRWQNGEKHIEGTTGEQLGYENVIILFCPYTYTNDSKNHIKVNDIGSGKGYYMTGGKYVEISWSKSYGDAAIKLTYSNGRELLLTPGKTNFEIVNSSSSITFNK